MSHHTTIPVALGKRSYEIIVGEGLLARAGEWIAPQLSTARAIIISDHTVSKRYAQTLTTALAPYGIELDHIEVSPGEQSKSFATLEAVCEQILEFAPDRKTTIIALGGGVVGDLAGFAASILLRGIPFIQIPTTLLAQVDSSVGGKTAINTKAGKNLIGSFYQPNLVLADLDTLKTLPPRERLAGYAEIIKYGLIMDEVFYRWCLANAKQMLAGDVAALQYAVAQCCRMKAEIVAGDEKEAGARALLNFGHTFGHALEIETGMGDKLLHGEAVAIGMVMACRLSARMGLIDNAVEHELTEHLREVGLAVTLQEIIHPWNAQRIAEHFISDKKAEAGTLTFVALEKLGKARVAKAVDPALALDVVQSFLKE